MIARLSLHARLLLIAAVTGLAALLFATVAIGHVLERFVMHGLDERLDTQIAILQRAVRPDGRLDGAKVVELPGFDTAGGGWSWRVRSPAGVWTGGDTPPVEAHLAPWHRHDDDRIVPGQGRTAAGSPVHLRRLAVALPSGALEIVAAAPQDLVERPLRAARGTLLVSLGLLGLGLAFATWLQLRYGLGPVRALRDEVARVRVGDAERLSADQPRELRPLADEVNALIAQNAAGLDNARRHLANLAHGLKTPLATLSLRLAREDVSEDTRALVDQLDQRIAHHLRRARSAAPSAGLRARASVAEIADDLVRALRHVHADRALRFDIAVTAPAIVAADTRDVEEMLGNLLDNACRHAAGRVRLSAGADGAMLAVAIEDDGKGMSDDEIGRAMQSGVRLDESGVGYGFGLGIARELIELYGGTLSLGRSAALGGLSATVLLPAPAGSARLPA